MGLFNSKKTEITVEFINAADGSTIGISKMPLSQLPDSFEIATTMELRNEQWSIASAAPSNKSEFSKSKTLKLTMHKVEMVNPADINYTLPSISAELPPIKTDAEFKAPNFELREDDWRQLEFLPKSSLSKMKIEISHIKDIWENHSKTIDNTFNTFSKLHIRTNIGIPPVDISLQKLSSLLEVDQIQNLTVGSSDAFVDGGFSLNINTHVVFGTVKGDKIQSLCLNVINQDSETTINKIVSSFNLTFINWYYFSVVE